GQLDPGDVQVAVLLGARGEHDRVVEALQVVELEVHAVLDVAEEADVGLVEHLVQRGDDPLDAWVVGSDAVPDEAERRRLALEEVDRDVLAALHQDVGDVDAGGPRAHDGDACRSSLYHCSSPSRKNVRITGCNEPAAPRDSCTACVTDSTTIPSEW